jgi:hypothetical protein
MECRTQEGLHSFHLPALLHLGNGQIACSAEMTADIFACRDRGITKLLQIDVSTSSSGALLITLSDQGAGFAPYRLDNNTSLTLHLR